jgi:hypothetical protein
MLIIEEAQTVVFILRFCILMRVLYEDYWKNRPSQQLFKVFIYTYFTKTCGGKININKHLK